MVLFHTRTDSVNIGLSAGTASVLPISVDIGDKLPVATADRDRVRPYTDNVMTVRRRPPTEGYKMGIRLA